MTTIRAATIRDAPEIAGVHVAAWRSAYRGILPDQVIDGRTLDGRLASWRKVLQEGRNVVLVAADSEGIVGFASAIILDPPVDGFHAYLQTLYLAPSAKGAGTGANLLKAIAGVLAEKNCTNLVLRVLRENPARGFYEHLGARPVPEGISIEGGLFDDVVYVFDDLTRLAQSALRTRRSTTRGR